MARNGNRTTKVCRFKLDLGNEDKQGVAEVGMEWEGYGKSKEEQQK